MTTELFQLLISRRSTVRCSRLTSDPRLAPLHRGKRTTCDVVLERRWLGPTVVSTKKRRAVPRRVDPSKYRDETDGADRTAQTGYGSTRIPPWSRNRSKLGLPTVMSRGRDATVANLLVRSTELVLRSTLRNAEQFPPRESKRRNGRTRDNKRGPGESGLGPVGLDRGERVVRYHELEPPFSGDGARIGWGTYPMKQTEAGRVRPRTFVFRLYSPTMREPLV